MRASLYHYFIVVGILIFAACKKNSIEIAEFSETPYTLNQVNGTLPQPNLPSDNPLTIEKFELGRTLFYSKLLSLDNSISCASCHIQFKGFSDPETLSSGVGGTHGTRQSMALINLAWNTNGFFWDGRAELLSHQVLMPIEDQNEMKETLINVCLKLTKDPEMRNQFTRAFGTSAITPDRIAKALEVFLLGLVSDNSKYDRYLLGLEELSDSEERGRILFFAEYNPFFPDISGADCAHCHAGNNFENDNYMNNGLDTDAEFVDYGRELVTGNASDRAKFKIPTLRNIALTSPYMHDGRFSTLEEVIEHYNNHIQNSSTVNPAIQGTNQTGLMLDEQEVEDLVNFLKTLTDYSFINNPMFADPN